jgi:hypothetical protein
VHGCVHPNPTCVDDARAVLHCVFDRGNRVIDRAVPLVVERFERHLETFQQTPTVPLSLLPFAPMMPAIVRAYARYHRTDRYRSRRNRTPCNRRPHVAIVIDPVERDFLFVHPDIVVQIFVQVIDAGIDHRDDDALVARAVSPRFRRVNVCVCLCIPPPH